MTWRPPLATWKREYERSSAKGSLAKRIERPAPAPGWARCGTDKPPPGNAKPLAKSESGYRARMRTLTTMVNVTESSSEEMMQAAHPKT